MRLVKMPRLGQDMEEGVIVEWHKSVGDEVAEGEILTVIETDKAEVAFESPVGGYLVAILLEAGAKAPTGESIAWIADDPSSKPPSSTVSQPTPPRPVADRTVTSSSPRARSRPAPRRSRRKPVSPLARRRATELGVDLAEVEGTGPGGRVTASDVERFHKEAPQRLAKNRDLSTMRKAIASQMSRSAVVPQFQLMQEVVVGKVGHQDKGPRPTYTDILLWATAQALQQVPEINASWVEGNPPSVRVHARVNLGMAVALDEGLIVPVIRDAAALTLAELAVERRRLEAATRRGRLRGDDLQGATFTVSNLGGAGVDEFIALVNPPEAGILAVGAVKDRPTVVEGRLMAASTVRLTLSGDHRVFDGMAGARFLEAIAAQLTDLRST